MNFNGLGRTILAILGAILGATTLMVVVFSLLTMWAGPVVSALFGAAVVYVAAVVIDGKFLWGSGMRLFTMPCGAAAAYLGARYYEHHHTFSGAIAATGVTALWAAVLISVGFCVGLIFVRDRKNEAEKSR
jgi:hypothetical protein